MFSGGKCMHIFMPNPSTRTYVNKLNVSCEEEVLERGEIFLKVDGSNGLVVWDEETSSFSIFQRHNLRKGPIMNNAPDNHIALPPGRNPGTLYRPDKTLACQYFYRHLDADAKGKEGKLNRKLYGILERNADDIIADMKLLQRKTSLSHHSLNGKLALTVELVGKKFNCTPGVPHEVGIAFHHQQKLEDLGVEDVDSTRNFESMKDFLLTNNVEGVIVKYQDLYWKIRSDCYDRRVDGRALPLILPKYYY